MMGMVKVHHNPPAIASGLMAAEMSAFAYEWAIAGGLELTADQG
jgi:hypothetical protein